MTCAPRLPRLSLLLLLAALAACGSTRRSWEPTRAGRYDALPAQERIRFGGACRALERGRLDEARAALGELAQRFPEHVAIGIWLQEADLARARQAGVAEDQALRELAARALAVAEASPTPARLVLAARLEQDEHAAAALCERALEADPGCAWAWYGRAFQAMRIKDWREAQSSVARALELDPGHLRTRRLEALLLARSGSIDEAALALEEWLDHARADATIAVRAVRDGELDLALAYVLAGEPRRAKRLLEGFEPGDVDEARRFEVLAACEQALDEWQRALDAARHAEAFAPDDPLALVQQALLYEYWFEEPIAAATAWQRVLEVAGEGEDLQSLLQRARAQVRVERARATAAVSALGGEPDAAPPRP